MTYRCISADSHLEIRPDRYDTPDQLVTDFCRALKASKDRVPWAEDAPLPLERMVHDTADGHLEVPLHPAAERFWRECGYLN